MTAPAKASGPKPARPAPDAARDDAYEARILDAAEEAFAAAGFGATRMKDVAAAARVSLASLYQRYPKKDALYAAVHARRLDALMPAVREAVAAAGSPLERLLAGLRAHLAFHAEHAAYLRLHLREVAAWWAPEELATAPQLAAWTRGQRDMAAAFARGMAEGVLVDDDPALCARTTNAITQVALARWVEAGRQAPPEALSRRLCSQIIRAFCVPERVPELLARHVGGAGAAGA